MGFFSIEKEEYSFHMGLKTEWTEYECFIWNVLLRYYINEFNRIVHCTSIQEELFNSYKKRMFFSYECDYLDSTEY